MRTEKLYVECHWILTLNRFAPQVENSAEKQTSVHGITAHTAYQKQGGHCVNHVLLFLSFVCLPVPNNTFAGR